MKQKRIAICFSAQVRTALYAVDNIKKFIGPLWDECDFFCHTWLKDTDKLFWDGVGLPENKITVAQDTIDKLHDIYKFKKFKMENWEELALTIPFVPPLFYSWIESLKQKQEYEQEHNFKYDYVVKLRLDNIYSDRINFQDLLNKTEHNSLAVNNVMGNNSIDDFLFVSDSVVADKLIEWYEPWVASTKTWFAHLELPYFLNERNIKLIDFKIDTNAPNNIGSDIGILRLIAVNFDPIKDYFKCVETDKILYWAGVEQFENVVNLSYDELLDLARRVKAKYNVLPNVLALLKDKI